MPELRTIKVTRDTLKKGDRLIEVGPHAVLQQAQKPRGLMVCKCNKWEWECQPSQSGGTICFEVCVGWTCSDVPATIKTRQ